ncbi:MAG: hypothetical protein NZ849_06555 [Meiothermus sp.]|uniref:hypothetical protein n=1 Tax=Meiothermus sp. TaxID=1955249 RepID=UPI0025D8DC88|nr:hypothetical protein [Meiothermus sp.]MCS7057814.1 hypothetical protein [Meiothermus sp.]MCS7194558.1 hypothetical protein [Meiothermus sp.]MCX7740847.1 hypothetical protein [Meiothermus sp.]MDW8092034.1 hypothetical protein [Meiothermus sp.]MDW8481827.1 hypothetical protein [Meiothermus sp.]
MRSLVLAFVLALSPLPNLPQIPHGSEIRVVSPDLLTVYVVWQVEQRNLVLQSKLAAPANREVRVLFRVDGGYRPPYNGITTPSGDVVLLVQGERISLGELLSRTYRLNLPNGRVLPEVR